MNQKSSAPEPPAAEGSALGLPAMMQLRGGELGTRFPVYQRGNRGREKGSDS